MCTRHRICGLVSKKTRSGGSFVPCGRLSTLRCSTGPNALAPREPGRVKELDALIDGFLSETGAVVPIPNPAFDPALYRPEEEVMRWWVRNFPR